MKVGMKKVGQSWLQFLINVFVFLLFILIVNLIKPAILEITDDIWCDAFAQSVKWSAFAGIGIHFVSIVLFAFLDNGKLETCWWIIFFFNIIFSIVWVCFFLDKYPTDDLMLICVSVVVFLLMYVTSYIFATMFMPSQIRFASPIASAILN